MSRWLDRTGNSRREVIPLSRVWALSRAFYKDPRNPAWQPRSMHETQAVLESVGLTGPFWQLTPSS